MKNPITFYFFTSPPFIDEFKIFPSHHYNPSLSKTDLDAIIYIKNKLNEIARHSLPPNSFSLSSHSISFYSNNKLFCGFSIHHHPLFTSIEHFNFNKMCLLFDQLYILLLDYGYTYEGLINVSYINPQMFSVDISIDLFNEFA